MAGAGDPGDRAGLEVGAVHDGGVEFVFAFGRKDRAAPRVEQRIVFENVDGGLDGIERRAAAVKHFSSGFSSLGQRGAIGRVALGPQRRALNDARAAVHHDGPVAGCRAGRLRSLGDGQCGQCNDSGKHTTNLSHAETLSGAILRRSLRHFLGIINSTPSPTL